MYHFLYHSIYESNFFSKGGVSGVIKFKKAFDFIDGPPTPKKLKLMPNGLTIDYKFSDWFEPIISQSCDIQILNDASNFFAYEDLLTSNERAFKIVIEASTASDPSTFILFDGWLNTETVEQRYLHNSTIRLTGSNYLSKIDNIHPPIIDTIQKTSLINVVSKSLRLLLANHLEIVNPVNILVNNNLYPTDCYTPTKSLFNIVSVDTENFWENNIDRTSGLECIKNILTPLDSYIYWWNGDWYIERYSDLGVNKTYKKYVLRDSDGNEGPLYNKDSSCENIVKIEPSTNIFSLNHLANQSLSIIPGLKTISVELDQKNYLNLVKPDFKDGKSHNLAEAPDPSIREWVYSTGTIADVSIDASILLVPYQSIFNPIKLTINSFLAFDMSTDSEYKKLKYNGIATKFPITVTELGTTLNVKWKWHCGLLATSNLSWNAVNTKASKYNLYYNIRSGASGWLQYDSTNKVWWQSSGGITPEDSYQTIEVLPEDVDQATGVYEASFTIPLSDVSGGSVGDTHYTLMLNYSTATGASNGVEYALTGNIIGDVEVTTTSSVMDNIIIADLSVYTFNKKEITIDLFDINNLNYRNGLYVDNNRTNLWVENGGAKSYPLAQWLIGSKFKLYGKHRRKIESDVKYVGFLKPLSLWYDGLDPSTRNYILTGYRYVPTADRYTASWWEYDPSEEINFL